MAVVLEKRHVYVGDCALQVQLRVQVSELVAEDDGGMSGTKLCLYLVGKRAAKLGGVGGRALVCLAGVGEMATPAGCGSLSSKLPAEVLHIVQAVCQPAGPPPPEKNVLFASHQKRPEASTYFMFTLI